MDFGIWVYLIIFVEKILENILASFRTIIYAAGFRHLPAVMTFITTLMWVFIASIVIVDVTNDPWKLVIYGIGQATGVYIGSFIEEKLALGNSLLYIIVEDKYSKAIGDKLRANGFGVTMIGATGHEDKDRKMLIVLCRRKDNYKVKKLVKSIDKHPVILVKKPTSAEGSYVLG